VSASGSEPEGAAGRRDATPATLSREDVVHVARLARLDLSEAEVDLFTAQLRTVLDHAADVAALDLTHLEPSSHPIALENVFRPDEPRPSLDRDEVLAAAPAVEADRFRVPRIVGETP
jgi:aspartyl-tRNA(Asn)/glutamyl-tRNA(Gln) amidotransferase subunit C